MPSPSLQVKVFHSAHIYLTSFTDIIINNSIKRRSAFAAHLRKHDIDITYVDIDAMALPLPPVAVNVPKRESVQEVMVIDVMPQRSVEAQQARQMHSDGQCVLVDLLSNLNPIHIQ